MKRVMILLVMTGLMLTANAQSSDVPSLKYSVATASFWSNWFLQADFSGSSFFGDRGNAIGTPISGGLLKDFRTNKGFSVALGKWFTPGLGLRTKFNGIWGRTVVSEDEDINASKYWTLNEQLLFNFSNLFAGYSETRFWNFVPYLSAGVGRNMSHNTYAMGLGAGLLNQWRISPKTSLHLDVSYGVYEPDFDGAGGSIFSRGLPGKDRVVSFEVGVTYHLGRATFQRVPDTEAIKILYQSQIEALSAQLADEQRENARLSGLMADRPRDGKTILVTELVAAPVSVFFNLGQDKIASRKDLQNVAELVSIALQKRAPLLVTGYADSATGSSDYNQELSLRRAQAVAKELVALGFPANRIEVKAGGGVDELSPDSYNRRVVIWMK